MIKVLVITYTAVFVLSVVFSGVSVYQERQDNQAVEEQAEESK